MIKIVNTNKHVHNGVDGGRTRKLRHISKIQTFKRGHDAIKPFCKDLFDVKKVKDATPEQCDRSEADRDGLDRKQLDFSQILEEKLEESPNGKEDMSMHSSCQQSQTEFRIREMTYSAEVPSSAIKVQHTQEELMTQEQTQAALVDSLGVEDELF
mmetsp:Transcript_44487/g.59022  ORF Transcript_44487/g.59022 Transcript_44487/m.59022 type:complete len:155 (+) Transcript_44487:164-628(+)